MDLQLEGKRCLVTGGSRGIGKAIAHALLAEGCEVAIAARDPARLENAAKELGELHTRRVVSATVDTASDHSVMAMVARVTRELGGIDVLVCSAARPGGQSAPPTLAEVNDENFYDDVNVKVMGYLRCAREVAPAMVAQRWGRIILISGLNARRSGNIIGTIRNVSVAALAKNLADELGPHGVNTTVVHPGLTRTEATAAVVERLKERWHVDAPEAERRLASNVSVGRLIDSSEVADVVTFLASPRSVSINGDAIVCGGGDLGHVHY